MSKAELPPLPDAKMFYEELAYSADQMRAYGADCAAAEREACAHICAGIGYGYAGDARRLDGQHATHAAGQRDGANQCAAAIRARAEP